MKPCQLTLVFLIVLVCLNLMACGGGANSGTKNLNSTTPAMLTIATSTIPNASAWLAYSFIFHASGGTPPYNWKLSAGNLPPGLTLSADGKVFGTPSQAGSFPFVVKVNDANQVQNARQAFTFNVLSNLTVSTISVPQATISQAYSATLTARGGTPPYTWQPSGSSSLPPGFSLTAGGILSGTPSQSGAFSFVVQVTDSVKAVASRSFDLVATGPSGTAYYVDATNGNDGNNGISIQSPWQTLARINSAKFAPGDQVLLKRGEMWREELSVPSSGSAARPIIFGAYGAGPNPVISGSDLVQNWAPNTGFVYGAAVSWMPFHIWEDGALLTSVSSLGAITAPGEWFYDTAAGRLYVWTTNSTAPNTHIIEADHRLPCIILLSKSYVTLENLAVQDSTGDLVIVVNSSNIAVRNSVLKNAAGTAITVVHVSPNFIVDNSTYSVDPGYHGRGFVLVIADGPTISNNTIGSFGGYIAVALMDVNNAVVHGNTITGEGIAIAVNASTHSVTGIQLYENSISGVDGNLGDGESIEFTGTNPFTVTGNIYRNVIQGGSNTFGGIDGQLAINCTVFGNIITNMRKYGLQWTTNSTGNSFYNNTIYNNGQAGSTGIGFSSNSTGGIVRNNIIKGASYGIGADPLTAPTISEDYNIVNGVSVVRASGIPAGAHTITSDPLFVSNSPSTSDDFKLQSSSPAIDSGEDLGAPYNFAFDPNGREFPYPTVDQNLLGTGWERGAFAFR